MESFRTESQERTALGISFVKFLHCSVFANVMLACKFTETHTLQTLTHFKRTSIYSLYKLLHVLFIVVFQPFIGTSTSKENGIVSICIPIEVDEPTNYKD